MIGRSDLLGRGKGNNVVVGLGNNSGCKGKSKGGGVVSEVV